MNPVLVKLQKKKIKIFQKVVDKDSTECYYIIMKQMHKRLTIKNL